MVVQRFVSGVHNFMVLTDGETWRFNYDTTPSSSAQEQWDESIPGEELEQMLNEFNRIKKHRITR